MSIHKRFNTNASCFVINSVILLFRRVQISAPSNPDRNIRP